MNSSVIRRLPFSKPKGSIIKGEGLYLFNDKGVKLLDMTAGYSACVALGYSNSKVIKAIKLQMENLPFLCNIEWHNPHVDELGDILTKNTPDCLDKVWFSGGSGSESIESAMKLSFLTHQVQGNKEKTWFISREESYHGITLFSNAITDLDIYDIYKPINPKHVGKIPQHNPYALKQSDESLDEYARRCADQLENKIIKIGPEKVSAFVAETMLGQLVGNVPAAPNYWKYVRRICDKYNVHLILDEIYCGLGRTGKSHCFLWDDVIPDFICVGKMLAAGYAPISAVITKKNFIDEISESLGRILLAVTYEAHPPGVAAALAVQKICQSQETLRYVCRMGEFIQNTLTSELGNHEYFKNVRGRGLLISFEYECPNRDEFNLALTQELFDKHNIIISAKFHRTNFTPPAIIKKQEIEKVLDIYISTFNKLSQ